VNINNQTQRSSLGGHDNRLNNTSDMKIDALNASIGSHGSGGATSFTAHNDGLLAKLK
jgi:hypothetical protein